LEWYHALDTNPITRQSLSHTYKGICELATYSEIDAKIVTVQIWIYSTIVYLGSAIVIAFLFKDFIITLIGLGYANVFKEIVLNKHIDKLHYKMLFEEADALSELRQEYLRLRSIPEALQSINPGKLIKRSIDEIYTVITSENVQENLDEFYNACPLKTVQTLAGVCYTVNESGEDPAQAGTNSIFVTALGMITNEVNLEIRRIRLIKSQFGALEWLPLAPLAFLKPIKAFFVSRIPGTAAIYDGTLGYIFLIICLVVSMVAYKTIVNITRPVAIKYDDREDFDKKMIKKKWVQTVATALQPRDDKSLARDLKLLKGAQSRLDIKYLYWRKFYFSVGAFSATLIILIASLIIGYNNTYNSVVTSGIMSGSTLTDKETEQLKALDEMYFSQKRDMTDEELEDFVKQNTPGLKSARREEQVERIRQKEEDLDKVKWKWWMLWIALAVGGLGWIVPNLILKIRTKMIQNEAEEDCLQLQTVIGIMMNTTIDTLDLLDWLSRHSRVFKHLLIEAYHNYPSDDYRALRELKNRAGLPDFKRIVDKLMLTVSQISIAEAFSDLLMERDHLLRMREIAQQESILKKRQQMSIVAMSPMLCSIGLYFIAPIGILGAKEVVSLINNLGNIT
jgi:ribosomal protein L29